MKNKPTKLQLEELRGWFARVHSEADRYGDMLDPQRQRDSRLAAKVDSISKIANEAVYYVDAMSK